MSPASFPWITQLPSLPLCLFFSPPSFTETISCSSFSWPSYRRVVFHAQISYLIIPVRQAEIRDVSLSLPSCRRNSITGARVYLSSRLFLCICELFTKRRGCLLVNVFLKSVKLFFLNQIIFLLLVFIFTQICPSYSQQHLDYNDSRMCLKKQQLCQGQFWIKRAYFFLIKKHNNWI